MPTSEPDLLRRLPRPPGLQNLLTDVRAGKITVVAASRDREAA